MMKVLNNTIMLLQVFKLSGARSEIPVCSEKVHISCVCSGGILNSGFGSEIMLSLVVNNSASCHCKF